MDDVTLQTGPTGAPMHWVPPAATAPGRDVAASGALGLRDVSDPTAYERRVEETKAFLAKIAADQREREWAARRRRREQVEALDHLIQPHRFSGEPL